MSLKERLKELNKNNEFCKLVEDLDHWGGYGIVTAEDLDDYLTREAFSNVYKSRNGFRPSGWPLEAMEEYLRIHSK